MTNPQPVAKFIRPGQENQKPWLTCNYCWQRQNEALRRRKLGLPRPEPGPEKRDPWFPICGRCALPACIRPAGAFDEIPDRSDYTGCPIFDAAKQGWAPGEALSRWRELRLFHPLCEHLHRAGEDHKPTILQRILSDIGWRIALEAGWVIRAGQIGAGELAELALRFDLPCRSICDHLEALDLLRVGTWGRVEAEVRRVMVGKLAEGA